MAAGPDAMSPMNPTASEPTLSPLAIAAEIDGWYAEVEETEDAEVDGE